MAFSLQSPEFQNNTFIPVQYTGEGDDLSPPLEWTNAPRGTQEFVLICEDPDAPRETPFVHWLMYHIPHSVHSLPEGLHNEAELTRPIKVCQGKNSFGDFGYGGPLPPIGNGLHHYVFKLYALSAPLNVASGAEKKEVFEAMEGKILDATQMMGKYIRESQEKTA